MCFDSSTGVLVRTVFDRESSGRTCVSIAQQVCWYELSSTERALEGQVCFDSSTGVLVRTVFDRESSGRTCVSIAQQVCW